MCAYFRPLRFFPGGLLLVLLVGSCYAAYGQDDIFVRSSSKAAGRGNYNWTIYIEASPSLQKQITSVEYSLPPSYRLSKRKIYKYPFRTSDTATDNSLDIGITVYFAENKFRVLPVYSLRLQRVIDNPGGVPITSVLRLQQYKNIPLTPAELEGLVVEVGDIHNDPRKPWPLKVYKVGGSVLKDGTAYSGRNIQLTFNYNGKDYILSGYAETGKMDFLVFRIFRKQ